MRATPFYMLLPHLLLISLVASCCCSVWRYRNRASDVHGSSAACIHTLTASHPLTHTQKQSSPQHVSERKPCTHEWSHACCHLLPPSLCCCCGGDRHVSGSRSALPLAHCTLPCRIWSASGRITKDIQGREAMTPSLTCCCLRVLCGVGNCGHLDMCVASMQAVQQAPRCEGRRAPSPLPSLLPGVSAPLLRRCSRPCPL